MNSFSESEAYFKLLYANLKHKTAKNNDNFNNNIKVLIFVLDRNFYLHVRIHRSAVSPPVLEMRTSLA